MTATSIQATLIDGHVHLHGCFDAGVFLDAAADNLQGAAKQVGLPTVTPGCLMMTECAGDRALERLQTGDLRLPERWELRPTREVGSLVACRRDGSTIVLVGGRQIVTAERLEVLALAFEHACDDGDPIETVIDRVLEKGGIPVIPWGFGKWVGRRGRIVERLLRGGSARGVFVGDNGGRPRFSAPPALFKLARRNHIRTLPGSDPFPLAWHETRAGTYGFVLEKAIDLEAPANCVRETLRKGGELQGFGRRVGLTEFIRANIGIRVHRQRTRGA